MEKIIYTKYSNDRSPEYRIRTDIIKDNGQKYIIKRKMDDAGEAHIKNTFNNYMLLKEQFAGSMFCVNEVLLVEDSLKFQFVEGESFDKVINYYFENNQKDKFFEFLDKYVEEMRKNATVEFTVTDEFKEMFGGLEFKKQARSMQTTDLDLIFSNIIIDSNDTWQIIDYEWTYNIPIPVDFIIFRSLHYFFHKSSKTDNDKKEIWDRVGINIEDRKLYIKMEEAFQDYLIKGNSPLWKLYSKMGKENLLGTEIERMKEVEKTLLSEIQKKEDHIVNITNSLNEREYQIARMTDSASWKITKPLRASKKILSKTKERKS